MESNHRFLDVSQASSPLDHGTVISVDPLGVAPRFPVCGTGVFLLDDEPDTVWKVHVCDPSSRHAPKDSNPDQLGWNQSCCQLHQGRTVLSGRRGTRTPKRLAPPPVFKTGSSSGRMPSTCQKAAVAGIEPASGRFRAASPYQHRPHRIGCSRHVRRKKARGEGIEPPLPGSKPGGLPLADPRSQGVPCGNRTHLARLEAWNLCRSVKGT